MLNFRTSFGAVQMSSPPNFPGKIRFGDYELDLATSELRTNGTKYLLQGQPYQILCTLLERPGELVTREELKKKLWSEGTFVDFDHSLNKAVNRLREVLADSAEEPKFIETLPRKVIASSAPSSRYNRQRPRQMLPHLLFQACRKVRFR
jgi:DNA-binding winged helix-turn-helix (wHTH) protein